MKKLAACLLALALLVPALPAFAGTFEIAVEGTIYEMTLTSVALTDNGVVATAEGYDGALPIRGGQLVIPFWAYAMKDGARADTTTISVTVGAEGAIVFQYTIDLDVLPDGIYLYPYDGTDADAVLAWSAEDEPGAVLRGPEDVLWRDYRLGLTFATTDEDQMNLDYDAYGFPLMLTFEEKDGAAIPADTLDEFYDDIVLELDGDSINPEEISPTVEEMNGTPQTAFSLFYDIPDGAAVTDLVLVCEGLRYSLSGVAVAEPLFADERFEEAVRAAAGVPEGPLTDEVLASVTELSIDTDACADLLGLALLPNLRDLTVYGYTVEDYSPLAGVTTLERLCADHTSLADLSVLAGCENLKELTILVSGVTDLSPLAAHAALESLTVTGCEVTDISALAGHTALKYLDLTACEVADVSPLSDCAGLETLILAENPVEDISPVAALPNLSNLDLSNCSVSDLTPLLDAVDGGLQVELSGNSEWEMPERPADPMAGVLDYFDDPLYAAAREYLQTGETLGSGGKGDPAKGLQTLIRALGKEISVDGSIGPKTMAAFNDIQEVFGLDETDAVDLGMFDKLLTILLIATDEDAAWELVSEESLMENDEIYYYAACVQAWPKNGELYRNPAYGGKKTYLNVEVDGDVDYATFIKVYAENGDYVLGAFIGGSSSVTLKLPGGDYYINKGSGYDWYGVNEAFGGDGYYATLYYDDETYIVTLKSGYEYTLTLNTDEIDPEANDVGTGDIVNGAF